MPTTTIDTPPKTSGTSQRFPLYRETLDWIERRAHKTESEITLKFPLYPEWKHGKLEPTEDEIQDLADFIYEQFHELVQTKPGPDFMTIPDYRNLTESGEAPVVPDLSLSPNLRDIYWHTKFHKMWLSDTIAKTDIRNPNWVGSFSHETVTPLEGAQKLSKLLGYDRSDRTATNGYLSRLVYLSEREGIIVRRNCFVRRNSVIEKELERRLDCEEFYGFTLFSEISPFIMINANLSQELQLYMLIHALSHLMLGTEGFDRPTFGVPSNNPVEAWCHAVAEDFLLPEEEFIQQVKRYHITNPDLVDSLCQDFGVSRVQVLSRMKTLQIETEETCQDIYFEQLNSAYAPAKQFFRPLEYGDLVISLGRRFVETVLKEYLRNIETPIEAQRLLGAPWTELDKLSKYI